MYLWSHGSDLHQLVRHGRCCISALSFAARAGPLAVPQERSKGLSGNSVELTFATKRAMELQLRCMFVFALCTNHCTRNSAGACHVVVVVVS